MQRRMKRCAAACDSAWLLQSLADQLNAAILRQPLAARHKSIVAATHPPRPASR